MKPGQQRGEIRLKWWEVALLALIPVLIAFRHQPSNPVMSELERAPFEQRYGPAHWSEREEEWLIRDFFQDRRDGLFVDVGANHYRAASKTYYLETNLGWRGLAVEPQVKFAADYASYRPRTKFLPFFVSERSDETAKLYVIEDNPLVASSSKEFVEQFGEPGPARSVPTIALTDLLEREHITKIDFLSMDIELHEPQALRGFDIERFRPSLVCIEALLPVRQEILDYFAAHRYVVVGKYVWVDRENLYFTPLSASSTPSRSAPSPSP